MQRPRSDYECPRVSSHSHTVSLTILDIIIDCVSSHVDSSSSGASEVWVNVTGSGLRLAIASKHHQSHLDSYYCSLCITKRSWSLCEPMTDEVIWRLSSCSQYLNKQHKCEHQMAHHDHIYLNKRPLAFNCAGKNHKFVWHIQIYLSQTVMWQFPNCILPDPFL